MVIAYNPLDKDALDGASLQNSNDIIFDLPAKIIWAKGVAFEGFPYSVFKKATNSEGGQNGLVPAPNYNNNSKTRFLKEDGTWEVPRYPSTMTGATASADGATGLVPKPLIANKDLFLKGDGTWATPAHRSITYTAFNGTLVNVVGYDLNTLNFKCDKYITYATATTNNIADLTIGINISKIKEDLETKTVDNKSTDDKFPTAKAVYDAINNGIVLNSAMRYMGTYDAKDVATASTVNTTKFSNAPGTKSLGWTWRVLNNGYFGNLYVEAGDIIISHADNPGTTVTNYDIIQGNEFALTKSNLSSTSLKDSANTRYLRIDTNGKLYITQRYSANVTTSAVLTSTAISITQLTKNQENPYYNLLEGGAVTRSIQFVSGSGILIVGKSDGSIGFTNTGVRSVTLGSGDNKYQLAVDTNGTTDYITVPYATSAGKVEKAIKFKKTNGTAVSYDGFTEVDLTEGINYATVASKLEGGTIPGWGTLTAANGYDNLASWDYSTRGAYGLAGKGGVLSMLLDGFFYQNEGKYRVLDTSDAENYLKYGVDILNWEASVAYNLWNRIGKVSAINAGDGVSFIITIGSHHTGTVNNTTFICTATYSGLISIREFSGANYSNISIRIGSADKYPLDVYIDLKSNSSYTGNGQKYRIKVISLMSAAIAAVDTKNVGALSHSSELTSHTTGAITTPGCLLVASRTDSSVGIGTVSPSAKLTVETTSAAGYDKPVALIQNLGNASWLPTLSLYNPKLTSGNYAGINLGVKHSTNNLAHWSFYYAGDGSTANRTALSFLNNIDIFVVRADGTVGIKTVTPRATLDVDGKDAAIIIGQKNKDITSAPSSEYSVDRLIITPPYHTGGPWKVTTKDDLSNAFLTLSYGGSELIRTKHSGNTIINALCSEGTAGIVLKLSGNNNWAYGVEVLNTTLSEGKRIGGFVLGVSHSLNNWVGTAFEYKGNQSYDNRLHWHFYNNGDKMSLTAKGYLKTTRLWLNYNSNLDYNYSWTNSALTVPSIEVLNYTGTTDASRPTITLHHYGYGGPVLSSFKGDMFIQGHLANGALSGGSKNGYFKTLKIYPNELDGLYVNDTKVMLGYRRLNLNIQSFDAGLIPPSVLECMLGYAIHSDPEFHNGLNGISVYNNLGNGVVTISRVADSSCGNSSGYVLQINSASGASPGTGGWYFADAVARGRQYTCIFRAKIPTGSTVWWNTNSVGSEGNYGWLTNNVGTGKWEWYAFLVYCGTSSFANTNFFYLNTASTWYLSFANTYINTWASWNGLKVSQTWVRSNLPWDAAIHSSPGREDNEAGSSWIFIDDAGGYSSVWGIKHNLPSNLIEYYGNGTLRAYINLNDNPSFFHGINSDRTIKSTYEGPAFLADTTAGTWAYLRLRSGGTQPWDIATNSSRKYALEFRAGGGEPTMWLDYAEQNTGSGLIHMRNGLEVIDDNSDNSNNALALFRNRNSADWTVIVDSTDYDYGVDIHNAESANYALRIVGGGSEKWRATGKGAIRFNGLDKDFGINFLDAIFYGGYDNLAIIRSSSNTLRFGGAGWNLDQWAGLKYNYYNNSIYFGIPDGNIFTANNVQSFGRLYTPRVHYLEMGVENVGHVHNYKRVQTYTPGAKHLTSGAYFKIAEVTDYFNFDIIISGGWHTGSPSVARINISLRNGYPTITQLSGFPGEAAPAIRLGQTATNTWNVLVYFTGYSSGSRAPLRYTFEGIGGITVFLPTAADTTTYTKTVDLTLGTVSGVSLTSGNYTSYTVTKTGSGASGSWGIDITGSSASCTGNAAGITGYTFKTLSSKSHSGWTNNTTDDKIITTQSFIAYWNGAYNSSGKSNLSYCNLGAFGSATTHAHSDYVTGLSISGNTLAWSKGGTAQTALTIPYATKAGKADSWTTARTITIGNAGKSVNGSANVSWSLNEIGAAAASHTHATTIASSTDTSLVTLAYGGKYKLSAGGSNYVFTMPASDNTWRGITDSYDKTDASISLSQKGANALYNALLNGYANSAGNADTVDGKHASDFATSDHTHYIATTQVLSSSTPAQNITGTGNITSNASNSYSLGSANNRWASAHIYRDFNIYGNESTGDESHVRFRASDNTPRAIITFNGNTNDTLGSDTHLKIASSYGDIKLQPGSGYINTVGHIVPNTDRTRDLGTPLLRWANIYGNVLRLLGSASNPSSTSGARIEFTYDYSSTIRDQPVYIGYTPNDSYRAPYGLKIWGGDGDTRGAWLEVTGNIYTDKILYCNLLNNRDGSWTLASWTDTGTILGAMAKTTYIRSGNTNLIHRKDGTDYIIYDTGNKPTYSDVGAAAASHTHSYLPLSGGTMTGTLTSLTVVPSADKTYTLGSSSAYWSDTYIKGTIIAYHFNVNSAKPFIVFDKPGSHCTGIGPDGTTNRIKFGPVSAMSSSGDWVALATFNANEWYFQGLVTATNHFYEASDIRFKTNLELLTISSKELSLIPLFDFDWINQNTGRNTGTSALAVLAILPNLVSGEDTLHLDYGVLGTIAGVTACKELVQVNLKISNLKSELEILKERVLELEKKLNDYGLA